MRAVRQLAEYYHKSPDKIAEEELREYFLYIRRHIPEQVDMPAALMLSMVATRSSKVCVVTTSG